MERSPARPTRRWLRAVQAAIVAVVGGVALVPNAYAAAQPAHVQKSATVTVVAKVAKDDPSRLNRPKDTDIWPGVTIDVGFHGCPNTQGLLVSRSSTPPTDGEIQREARAPRNTAVFWTGWAYSPAGARTIARCPAESIVARQVSVPEGPARTLEMAVNNLRLPEPDDRSLNAERLWTRASRSFAESASGVVRVVRGQVTRPGNVWDTHEYPILTRNGTGVTRILQYDMLPDGGILPPRVIWRNPACGGSGCP
jgi:hypothetical protein